MALTAENINDDKGPKILAVLWTLTALTTLMVMGRIFIRVRMLKNFGIDDYLIVISMVRTLSVYFPPCKNILLTIFSLLDLGSCLLWCHDRWRSCGIR